MSGTLQLDASTEFRLHCIRTSGCFLRTETMQFCNAAQRPCSSAADFLYDARYDWQRTGASR